MGVINTEPRTSANRIIGVPPHSLAGSPCRPQDFESAGCTAGHPSDLVRSGVVFPQEIFSEVALEAAARASAKIKAREAELAGIFRSKGLGVHEVDRESFRQAVLKNVPPDSMGFDRKDYDRIVAIK